MKGIPGCFSLFVLLFAANKSILHLSCLQKYFSGKSNVSNEYSSYCRIIPSPTVTINGRSIWLKHCSQISFTVCISGFLHVYAHRLIKIGYLCNWFKESEMLVWKRNSVVFWPLSSPACATCQMVCVWVTMVSSFALTKTQIKDFTCWAESLFKFCNSYL